LKVVDIGYVTLIVLAGIFMLIYSFQLSTIDIHIHDTKFVIAYSHIAALLLIYLLSVGFANYWITTKRKQVSVFQWLVFVFIALFLFWILNILRLQPENGFFHLNRKRYLDLTGWHNFNQFEEVNKTITILFLVFLATQMIFWIYFFILVVKNLFLKK
jgi:heme/copper-type cytochrome/quinol oxidase subunit 1